MTIAEEYSRRDALGLADLVKRREVKPIELVEEAIRRIEALNPKLNAVVHKLYDLGRRAAESELPDGTFRGVPFLVKDLATMWQGVPVSNGCRYFKDFIAPVDWETVKRMRQSGLVLVGKTNTPENGWSITTEPALFGATHNPWNDGIVPGGSSGGSAAAVASGMVPMADASDGGGSIRIPAANNGLVGLKPSRGRSTVGPDSVDFWYGGAVFLCVSRTVRDTAAYLDAVGGALPGEPYALAMPAQSYLSQVDAAPGRLRIGFTTKTPGGNAVHPEARAAVENAAKWCSDLGHDVTEGAFDFDLDAMLEPFARITATLSAAGFEASEAVIGRPVSAADVEPVTWGIIELGRRTSGVQHANDVEAVRAFGRKIVGLLAPYDVFITPTQPQPPRALGWYDMSDPDLSRYNSKLWRDVSFTAPFNMSGQPAITLPLHMTADKLPLGVQFIGRIGDEATLLRLAGQLEQAHPWKDRRPPVSL